MDCHMHFLEFLPIMQKRGLSYAIYEISFSSPKTWTIVCNLLNFFYSPKTWTIICNFLNFFLFSKNVVSHMQLLEFLSLLQKHGPSYAISRILFSSPKTWTIICNF